jgi:hypothetical protein
MNKQQLTNIIKEMLKEETIPVTPTTKTPSDVIALDKTQSASSSLVSRSKAINSIQEFPGAFENWFKTLGFQPGKISKSAVRAEVEKVLTKLGYK